MHCWVSQIFLYTCSQISESFVWDFCFFLHTYLPIYLPTCLCIPAHKHNTLLLLLPHLPAYICMHTAYKRTHGHKHTHSCFLCFESRSLNNLCLQILEKKTALTRGYSTWWVLSDDSSVVVHKDGTTGQVLICAECLLCIQTVLKTAGFCSHPE